MCELDFPSPRSALIAAGGAPVDPATAGRLPRPDVVIAADGGLAAARRLGLAVDLLIGDLDSVDADDVGGRDLDVERHPRDKDRTDLVLALDRARSLGARRVTVVSGGGGRLDHALGNLLVLAAPAYAAQEVDAVIGTARVTVVRGRRTLSADDGAIVSLFAVGGPARGVTTTGLRFALDGAELAPLSSLGLSNELDADTATVVVGHGVVLAVQPGPGDGE